MFLANIVLAQTLKFNAYDALKEQSVIDIQESYKLDSMVLASIAFNKSHRCTHVQSSNVTDAGPRHFGNVPPSNC